MLRSTISVLLAFIFISAGLTGCADRADESGAMDEAATANSADPGMADGMSSAEMTKLNLNTATVADFKTIPGMTDRMVREFDEYRPYASIQQFRREIGKYVDEDVVAGYEQYVFVPVDPNNCDAETLMQIPGVDESVVEEIVASRPFQNPEAFLDVLAPMVTAEQFAQAGGYLIEE